VNILLITKDASVLREGSEARATLLEQSKLVDNLFVIVLNVRGEHFETQRVSETVLFVPTNSWAWWLTPFDALHIAHREFFFQGRFQADLVAAYDPCESGVAALLVGRKYGKPLHLHIEHNVFSPQFVFGSVGHFFTNGIRAIAARFVARGASAIHVTSEDIKVSLVGIVRDIGGRIAVFPHFIDIESFQNEPVHINLHTKYPQFKFVLLVATPIESTQYITRSIEVLAGVLKQYAHAGLVIVGESVSARAVHAQAKRLGVGDHVVAEETSENLVSYLKTANVFLMFETREDTDNLIAKAVACGCPVVSTSVGIAPLIISDGESGFLCASDDVGCFVGNVMKLLNSTPMRVRIKANSFASLQKVTGETREDYQQLVKDSWQRALKDTPATGTMTV